MAIDTPKRTGRYRYNYYFDFQEISRSEVRGF